MDTLDSQDLNLRVSYQSHPRASLALGTIKRYGPNDTAFVLFDGLMHPQSVRISDLKYIEMALDTANQ
jgi:hypothetical protein